MVKVRDRSDGNVNTGVVTGRSDLNQGYEASPTGKTPEPVATASDDLTPVEGNVPCEGGPAPKSGPQGLGKAQGPVTAYPSAAPAGVRAAIGSRSQLATGPAVSNPSSPSATITSK